MFKILHDAFLQEENLKLLRSRAWKGKEGPLIQDLRLSKTLGELDMGGLGFCFFVGFLCVWVLFLISVQ